MKLGQSQLIEKTVSTTFDMLLIVFTVALIIDKYANDARSPFMNFDYFLLIILMIGVFLLLLNIVELRRAK